MKQTTRHTSSDAAQLSSKKNPPYTQRTQTDAGVAVPLKDMVDRTSRPSDVLEDSADGSQVVGLPITEGCLTPKGFVRYVAPCAGGWGIVRGAIQVPDSVILFTAPAGCGRHGSLSAIMNGYRDRIYYLDATESDLVMGTHLERVKQAVAWIMEHRRPRPRAFLLFSTCVDDLLGSDYRGLAAEMEHKYGIPFVDGHMDPVTMTSHTPPPVTLQRTIYHVLEHLPQGPHDEHAINIIGGFAPVAAESELYPLLKQAGYQSVHQIAACKNFDEFAEIRLSHFNILLKAFGRLACDEMKKKWGTPYKLTGMPMSIDHVAHMYDALGEALGVKLEYEPYKTHAQQSIEEARSWLSGKNVAVGSSLNGSTFEIAALLQQAGAHIVALVAEEAAASDAPYVDELMQVNPTLPVYPSTNPRMATVTGLNEPVDIAVGFDVGRLCPEATCVPWGVDQQPFGFQAIEYLLSEVKHALTETRDTRKMLLEKTLVV